MASFWERYPRLADGLEEVKRLILSQEIAEDEGIRESVRMLVESNGKMLRPGFVLLASLFGEPDADKMVRLAAAVEILHVATLIHDDIIDESLMRRGVPTLSARFGPRTAVLAGDSLFAACFSLIAEHVGAEDARSLAHLVRRICGSEIDQYRTRSAASVSIRRYLRRIAGKTAALFSVSLFAGARQSGCPDAVSVRLRRAGYCIGMGFQIMDDVLDVEGDAVVTGKPGGRDLAQGVVTLPVVLALRNDPEGRLAAALAKPRRSPRAVRNLARMVGERGGVREAKIAAGRYTDRALREISLLPASEPREILTEVTTRLLSRRS
jgi:heptaprenyl diphosphate synthase